MTVVFLSVDGGTSLLHQARTVHLRGYFNIMKSPSPKCYMTFWDVTIYNDTLNWSDITPICEFITELDFNTDFDLITEFWRFP